MAVPYILKRTTVASRVPTTSDIVSGQLGINLTDQKLFCSNGTGVFEIGSNLTSLTVSNTVSIGNACSLGYVTYTTTGTGLQTIDTIYTTIFRAVSYTLSVKDNSANGYQISSINMLYDGTNAILTEYGLIYSNTNLISYSATANSTTMSLQVTPTSSNTTIRIQKTLMMI